MYNNREISYSLKDHQKEIVNKIKNLKDEKNYIPERIGLLLAPGAGKTFLAKKLCEVMGYNENNILVISPLNAIKDNTWEGVLNVHFEAVEGFFGYNTSFEKALELFLKANDIEIENLVLIVDEFHNLKNLDTLIRRLTKRIMKKAKTSIFLSGTPSGRNEFEEFNQLNLCFSKRDADFLGAAQYGMFYDVIANTKGIEMLPPVFLSEVGKRGSRNKKEAVVKGTKYVVEDMEEWFQTKLIHPATNKNYRDTYFNFETKFYGIEYVTLKDKYKNSMKDFINKRMFVFRVGEEKVDFDYSNYVTKQIKVKIEDDFEPIEIIEGTKAAELTPGQPSLLNYQYAHCKLDIVYKILEKHKDEPVVIWSSYIAERDILSQELEKYNIKLATKENLILFKEGKIRGIIASSFSDKEAHNWVHCRLNIYFSPNNSSTSFPQSRFRTNRIGQESKVYYYFLYFEKEKDIQKRMMLAYNRNKASLSSDNVSNVAGWQLKN